MKYLSFHIVQEYDNEAEQDISDVAIHYTDTPLDIGKSSVAVYLVCTTSAKERIILPWFVGVCVSVALLKKLWINFYETFGSFRPWDCKVIAVRDDSN